MTLNVLTETLSSGMMVLSMKFPHAKLSVEWWDISIKLKKSIGVDIFSTHKNRRMAQRPHSVDRSSSLQPWRILCSCKRRHRQLSLTLARWFSAFDHQRWWFWDHFCQSMPRRSSFVLLCEDVQWWWGESVKSHQREKLDKYYNYTTTTERWNLDKCEKNTSSFRFHLPSAIFCLTITETSEATSTIKAKLQITLMSVRVRSKPVRRRHQLGFLQRRKMK